MPAERSGPAVSDSSGNMGGKGEMIKGRRQVPVFAQVPATARILMAGDGVFLARTHASALEPALVSFCSAVGCRS
jgi:hypothetical protein